MFIWILTGFYSVYRIYKSNKKITLFTQLSTRPPVDKYNRIYFAITKSSEWTESNNINLYSYDGLLANTTSRDLKDWYIKLKVPDTTKIENTWNCHCIIEDNYLYITLSERANDTILSNSEELFGFLLTSENDLSFRSPSISGRLCKKYWTDKLFILCLVMTIFSALANLTVFIMERFIKKQNLMIVKRQEHDNQIIEQTMKTFTNFIDNKDTYTQGHSTRVAAYVREMAKRMGMSEQEQLNIYYAGLMHDIGKLTIADEVLNKTSRLSSEEWNLIQQHTTNGAALLKNFTILPEVNDAVLYHHERYDGTGYMAGLAGEDIPLVARIICVADALDAMNSDRCYRQHLDREHILSELEDNKGTQFDPKLADIVIEMINSGEIFVGGGSVGEK
jgi:putative nucleotidyltransferase with HDIG domain